VLRGAFLTDALATVLAMPIALFPMVVAQRFGGAPQTLGLLFSAIAVGGVVAGALSGAVTRSRRPGSTMLAAATVWGLGIAGFGLAGQLWLVLLCLAVAGAADTVSVISRGTVVQLATPDSHRGRVSAVEHVIGVAGPDLGTFRGGLVAGLTSAAFAAVSGGLLCVLGVALVAARNPALRRFDAAAHTDPETLSAARP
jgi:MFS family permease